MISLLTHLRSNLILQSEKCVNCYINIKHLKNDQRKRGMSINSVEIYAHIVHLNSFEINL